MADKTFGVKVSEELYDKVKVMIENSGDSSKEWFEKAVSSVELQSIKQGSTDYSQDLTELEVHTGRIYELISNMIQRSIFIKDHAVKEVSDKLEQKEAIIGEYQSKAAAVGEELKQAQESKKVLEQDKSELSKMLHESQVANDNNQLLIHEYKEKNDTLSGLVNKFQAYADENEQLKESFSEISVQNDKQQTQIKELQREMESLKVNHVNELERKDYEKEKELLVVERNYQQKLLESNEDYNSRIKALYEEMDTMRKEYEGKIEKLQQAPVKQPAKPNQRNQNKG